MFAEHLQPFGKTSGVKAGKMKKTLVIVGNGPLTRDLSSEIDSADYVLRFNEPRESIGMSGSKTDLLMLATSSKQMQQWLKYPTFLNSAIFRNAQELLFAFHPAIIRQFHHRPNFLSRWLKGRRADWTTKAIEVLGAQGKEIRIMPPQFYLGVCEELGITADKMAELFPSTGFSVSGICCAISRRANGTFVFADLAGRAGNTMTGARNDSGSRKKSNRA